MKTYKMTIVKNGKRVTLQARVNVPPDPWPSMLRPPHLTPEVVAEETRLKLLRKANAGKPRGCHMTPIERYPRFSVIAAGEAE